MAYNNKKIKKILKKKEELPSFLKDLTVAPEEFNTPPKPKKKQHLGPVFFGEYCELLHPPLHELNLATDGQYQKVSVNAYKQTIDDLFYDKTDDKKPEKCKKAKEFQAAVRRKRPFYDLYSHKCPGKRKAFVPNVKIPEIDLGKTTSVIEGETIMEIPFCRFKTVSYDSSETDLEFILPSDLREKNWKYMPYKEQISHSHFPKRFVTVTMNGPVIPADITITKLPCKRTREYDTIFIKTSKVEVMENEVTEGEDEAEEEETYEMMSDVWADEQSEEFEEFSKFEESVEGLFNQRKSDEMEEEGEGGDEGLDLIEGSSEMAEEFEEIETDEKEIFENDETEEDEVQGEENSNEGQEQE